MNASVRAAEVRETAVRFGENAALVGVLTEPAAPPRDLGVVFLDAGLTHHVGPQRLHVALARRLARLGCTSLRFDHAGIGDSPRPHTGAPFAARAVREARAALDHLQQTRGLGRGALFGLCQGADNAVRTAAADARVVGVAAVDFYAVLSLRWLVRFYFPRLLQPRSWRNLVRGRSAVTQRVRALLAPRARAADRDGPLAVRAPGEVLAEIESLVARGADLCFAYAASGGSYDWYVKRFRRRMRALAASGRLRVRVFEDCDHVFTPRQSQEELGAYVEEWVRALLARP